MKKSHLLASLTCLSFVLILLSSCKKTGGGECGCRVIPIPQPIVFEILDKNGNNIIHSVNDNLWVTYTDKNGQQANSSLDILKLQQSITDTTPVDEYNGFAITDMNPLILGYEQGFMTTIGVNNFKLYLNGNLVGSIYIDGRAVSEDAMTSPNPKFTLNGLSATVGNITGIARPGNPADLKQIPYGGIFPTSSIYVLSTGQEQP